MIILQNQNFFLWPNNFSLFSWDQAALWTVLSIDPSVCPSEFVGLDAVIIKMIKTDLRLTCIGHMGPVIWNEILKNINSDTSVVSFNKIVMSAMIMWKY